MQLHFNGRPGSGFSVDSRLHHPFEERVRETPDNIALIFEDRQISFAELDLMAEAYRRGIDISCSGENIVAVSSTPSVSMVAGILGILKSGRAFLPVDPRSGSEKLGRMIRETGVKAVIDSSENELFSQQGLKVIHALSNPVEASVSASPEKSGLAYVIFTSGSTGCCKAVPVRHDSVLNYLDNAIKEYTTDNPTHSSSYFHLSLTFDASLTSLFVALSTGKKLVLASPSYKNRFSDPNFLAHAPYDYLKITPYQLFELESLKDDHCLKATSRYVIGGENLHYSQLRVLSRRNISAEIINEYGPTETCIGCMLKRIHLPGDMKSRAPGVPVGQPMKGVQIWLLNEAGKEVRPGEMGEICISGVQVAASYFNRPDLSAGCFTSILSPEGKKVDVYRTGDIAVKDINGDLVYICRKERLGMVRAGRYLSNLIESEISSVEGIRHAFVRLQCEQEGRVLAVAYVTTEETQGKSIQMRQKLKSMSRELGVNLLVIKVKEFPLGVHKKLNRHMLPSVNTAALYALKTWKNNTHVCREHHPGVMLFLHLEESENDQPAKEPLMRKKRMRRYYLTLRFFQNHSEKMHLQTGTGSFSGGHIQGLFDYSGNLN